MVSCYGKLYWSVVVVSTTDQILYGKLETSGLRLFKYASPQTFFPLAGKMIPWFATAAVIFGIVGLYIGFFLAPTDHQQGESYRIIFLHVPAAWMSMFIYIVMAFWAGI